MREWPEIFPRSPDNSVMSRDKYRKAASPITFLATFRTCTTRLRGINKNSSSFLKISSD